MFEKTIDNWAKVWYNMGTEQEKAQKQKAIKRILSHEDYDDEERNEGWK